MQAKGGLSGSWARVTQGIHVIFGFGSSSATLHPAIHQENRSPCNEIEIIGSPWYTDLNRLPWVSTHFYFIPQGTYFPDGPIGARKTVRPNGCEDLTYGQEQE